MPLDPSQPLPNNVTDLLALQSRAADLGPRSYCETTIQGCNFHVVQQPDGGRVIAVRRADGKPLPGGAEAFAFPIPAASVASLARAIAPAESIVEAAA